MKDRRHCPKCLTAPSRLGDTACFCRGVSQPTAYISDCSMCGGRHRTSECANVMEGGIMHTPQEKKKARAWRPGNSGF